MPRKKMKKGKGRNLLFNPWNHDAEIGDRMIAYSGTAYLLYESNGRNKASAGILSMRIINPPVKGARAILENGTAYWEW